MSVKFKNPKTGKVFVSATDAIEHKFGCDNHCYPNLCTLGISADTNGYTCSKYAEINPYEVAKLMGYEVVKEDAPKLDLTKFTVGVGVQCKTEEEAKELLGALHNCGYKWYSGDELIMYTLWDAYREQTIYFRPKEDKKIVYSGAKNKENVIQFTDLIVREEESAMENIKPRMCEILGLNVGEKFTVENENPNAIFHIDDSGRVTTGTCDIASRVLCDIINHPEKIKLATILSEEEETLVNAVQLLYPRAKYIKKTNDDIIVSSNCRYITTLQHLEFPNLPMDKEIDITEF